MGLREGTPSNLEKNLPHIFKKGILENEAVIICAEGCFHGRTIAIVSMSSDPSSRNNFGPFLPGLVQIPYNNAQALDDAIRKYGHNVAGFLVEPIQGEAGVFVPGLKLMAI